MNEWLTVSADKWISEEVGQNGSEIIGAFSISPIERFILWLARAFDLQRLTAVEKHFYANFLC